jgi:hypothetical protein
MYVGFSSMQLPVCWSVVFLVRLYSNRLLSRVQSDGRYPQKKLLMESAQHKNLLGMGVPSLLGRPRNVSTNGEGRKERGDRMDERKKGDCGVWRKWGAATSLGALGALAALASASVCLHTCST